MTKAESAASRTPMVDNALIDNGELVGKFPEWVRADLARALELEAPDLRRLRNRAPWGGCYRLT